MLHTGTMCLIRAMPVERNLGGDLLARIDPSTLDIAFPRRSIDDSIHSQGLSRPDRAPVRWASMCRSSPEWGRWISTRRRASTRSTRTDGGWPRGSAVRGAHVAGGASPLGASAAQLRRRLRQRCGRRPQLGDRHRTRRPHHRLHRGEPHQPQSPSSPRPPATDPAPKPLGQLCSRCCDGAASRSTTVAAYF